ncbi:uncharacterized protein TNCV_1399401 [Trichonephila clavipes]|nr:uncharacterized protein TNCV_1399401 [Trichonephila clavipes]
MNSKCHNYNLSITNSNSKSRISDPLQPNQYPRFPSQVFIEVKSTWTFDPSLLNSFFGPTTKRANDLLLLPANKWLVRGDYPPGGSRYLHPSTKWATLLQRHGGGVDPILADGNRFNSCQVIYSQFGLAIHQNDHQARRRFVEWAQNEIAVVPDFHERILFSDEAHFWLNGYVNKQNCRIWSEANPQVYVETPLHPEKLTVWCALWAGGIIAPYFFKNDEGHNVTVNGDRYRAMITNFFIPELNNHDVQELWLQQDGATCLTARATIDLLKDTFGDRLISRFGPVNCLQDLVI